MPINSHAARRETGTGELVDTELSDVSTQERSRALRVVRTRHCQFLRSVNFTAKDLPSQDPCFQLPSMPLHLIAMLIDTSEEVRPAMHVQHDSVPFVNHPRS